MSFGGRAERWRWTRGWCESLLQTWFQSPATDPPLHCPSYIVGHITRCTRGRGHHVQMSGDLLTQAQLITVLHLLRTNPSLSPPCTLALAQRMVRVKCPSHSTYHALDCGPTHPTSRPLASSTMRAALVSVTASAMSATLVSGNGGLANHIKETQSLPTPNIYIFALHTELSVDCPCCL